MMTCIKICGIRQTDHAIAAVEAGADLIGLVFYPGSKRRVSLERSLEICAMINRANIGVVGLFVNQTISEISELAASCALDYIQMSGDESPMACCAVAKATGLPIIKTIRTCVRLSGTSTNSGHASAVLRPHLKTDKEIADLVSEATRYPQTLVPLLLVDAPSHNAWGGTGQPWDYATASKLAYRRKVLLAGGLNSDNVAEAIQCVRPWGVDVSSGVETDGVKDPGKIAEFIHVVRRLTLQRQDWPKEGD